MICTNCLGSGCDSCTKGFIWLHVKDNPPSNYAVQSDIFDAYLTLDKYHAWPEQGGTNSQPAVFLEGVKFLDSIRNRIERNNIEARNGKNRHKG